MRPGDGNPRSEAAALGELAGEVAREALSAAAEVDSAQDAELLASSLVQIWDRDDWEVPLELTEALGIAVIDRIARAGDVAALIALHGLAAVGDHPVEGLAERAASGLAGELDPPAWVDAVGGAEAVEAVLMREPVFDDALSAVVELAWPNGERCALTVLIDHNLGGIAKDAFVGPSIARIKELADRSGEKGIVFEPLSPADAAARIVVAMEETAATFQAPMSESYGQLSAFAMAQLGDLSLDGQEPEHREVPAVEREALLDAFFDSPHGATHAGDAYAADVTSLAIDFCCDYIDGGALRWSPVVVELFMADWLPRKVVIEDEFFERVPAVLGGWIRFAGERRGIPSEAIEETVAEIERWVEPMLDAVTDPAAWGPATALAREAMAAGVDLRDHEALSAYIEARNSKAA